jgi:alpha-glucosidase (family GH31 glycosyl hydrolase)
MMHHIICILILLISQQQNPYVIDGEINKYPSSWNFIITNTQPKANDLTRAFVLMQSISKSILNIKIFDDQHTRYEPSFSNIFLKESAFTQGLMDSMNLTLKTQPFGFSIGNPAITTIKDNAVFTYQDKLIDFTMQVSSDTFIGLGQQVGPLLLCQGRSSCTFTLWNRGGSCPINNGNGGANCYGYHPFLMGRLSNGEWFGMLIWSTNAMDVLLDKLNNGISNLRFKIIGGIINLYYFYPGTAESITTNYHTLIGKPALLPMWSLGWHQAKLGWKSSQEMRAVVDGYINNKYPLDGLWADVDYMNANESFTIGKDFSDIGELASYVQEKNVHFMPIIETGIKINAQSDIYKNGLKMDGFIKSASTNSPIVGKSDAGYVVYPDFQNPTMIILWQNAFANLWKQVQFDGIWLDQNEPYSKCLGECMSSFSSHDPNEFDDLPYYPGNENLNDRTISLTAYQKSSSGLYDDFLKLYNTHNLFGLQELMEAQVYFNDPSNNYKGRPFILSRSTFPSSGSFGGTWFGDNTFAPEYFSYSISGVVSFQIFGIPFAGPNICGYSGYLTEDECYRWMQLGSALPFSRMNYDDSDPSHIYPYQAMSTNPHWALIIKYILLKYYYTLMYQTAINGGTYVSPVIFNFPTDNNTLQMTDTHFMIGKSLLVSPILKRLTIQVSTYFPNANWYNFHSHKKEVTFNPTAKEGTKLLLMDPWKYINIHVLGGNIIPYQPDIYLNSPLNVYEANNNFPLALLVAPDHYNKASGELIVDDGISKGTIESGKYRGYKFTYGNNHLVKTYTSDYEAELLPSEYISYITVMGYSGNKYGCLTIGNGVKLDVTGTIDDSVDTITYYLGGHSLRSFVELAVGSTC